MRRIIALALFALVALALCGGAWVLLQPNIPTTADQATSQPDPSYQAGGSQCEDRALASITNGAARQAKRDACAYQKDQHRLEQEDLVQQTRSANAGAVIVALTQNQGRIALLSSVVSTLATVALIWTLWETQNQAALSRREFMAVHGPKMGLTRLEVWKTGRGELYGRENVLPTFLEGEDVTVGVVMFAAGSGRCKVTSSDCEIMWVKGDAFPAQNPLSRDKKALAGRVNKKTRPYTIQLVKNLHLKPHDNIGWIVETEAKGPNYRLYVNCNVFWKDECGNVDMKAFFRLFDKKTGRFVSFPNPYAEAQD